MWAPDAEQVDLVLCAPDGDGERLEVAEDRGARLPRPVVLGRRDMERGQGGWWRLDVEDAGPGTDYAFALDGGHPRPDPRARHLPYGVHGPSRVWDPSAATWSDDTWRGTPLAGAVLYEMHVGTFTSEGTLDAAVEHLDDLVDLGVTAVELLPVNASPVVTAGATTASRGGRCTTRTAVPTRWSASSMPRTPRAWPSSSTRSTTTSGPTART